MFQGRGICCRKLCQFELPISHYDGVCIPILDLEFRILNIKYTKQFNYLNIDLRHVKIRTCRFDLLYSFTIYYFDSSILCPFL
jgi:hypothetical protein